MNKSYVLEEGISEKLREKIFKYFIGSFTAEYQKKETEFHEKNKDLWKKIEIFMTDPETAKEIETIMAEAEIKYKGSAELSEVGVNVKDKIALEQKSEEKRILTDVKSKVKDILLELDSTLATEDSFFLHATLITTFLFKAHENKIGDDLLGLSDFIAVRSSNKSFVALKILKNNYEETFNEIFDLTYDVHKKGVGIV